jgi:hypothetical protein
MYTLYYSKLRSLPFYLMSASAPVQLFVSMIRLTCTIKYGTLEVVSGMHTPAFHSSERVTVSLIRQRSSCAVETREWAREWLQILKILMPATLVYREVLEGKVLLQVKSCRVWKISHCSHNVVKQAVFACCHFMLSKNKCQIKVM